MLKLRRILIQSALLCGLVISVSACGGASPLEIISKPTERARLNLDFPPPISLESPKWVVITPNNSTDVFRGLTKDTDTAALYGLTNEQYMQLAIDLSNIRQHMILQREIIKKYKEYYEPVTK
jgi:hypothetical protein